MGLEHRPYIGSWRLNQVKLVQHAPDCLVYFNGDTSLPGCATCNGRIDMQKYITQVSVESGVDPGAASASISLAIPTHTAEGMGRDSKYILTKGLEIHIYMRGYFPVQGQYQNIQIEEDVGELDISNMMTYPYYHVFHGVVTGVDISRQGGMQSFTVQCNSMMYFWQYHNITQNASVLGPKVANGKLKSNLVGHQFTGWTPYSIIYTLFHDVAGAAGGVGYALSQKTNVNANSSVGDESLFSLSMSYWERRFQTKMIHLKMHGASGKLFNTAQGVFLGRLSGSSVRSVLKHFKGPSKASQTNKFDIFSASYSLGLTHSTKHPVTGEEIVKPNLDVNIVGDTDLIDGIKKDARAEINATDLQPYAQNLGELGEVNFYESTYQSKLDVAQQICQVTGYEFYQDVDGDFVFKPPLYNLDTSSSRVYRIENIDIISIAEHDKEPACTYMTFTGSQFQNLQGTGVEGEWGTRGQYVDYRLVAQFGWRPESFESSYHNNPRTMFFAAINRMDILNAATRSAEISIPLRPELRPGYPVYIPGIDCYYYLQNMSHSWTFGGSCTTNLNLIAKRPKFYAPGHTRKKGISSIDLSQMYLPAKPLQVLDEDGHPRLSGFPNVVLALNPAGINPLHFVVGADMKELSNPLVVKNLIKVALEQRLIRVDYDQGGAPETGPYLMDIDDVSQDQLDPLGTATYEAESNTLSGSPDFQGPIKLTFQTFAAGANLISAVREQRASVAQTYEKLIVELTSSLKDLIEKRNKLIAQGQENTETLDTQILQKEKDINQLKDQISEAESALQEKYLSDPQMKGILDLFHKLTLGYLEDVSDYPEPNTTASYLDLLSDKKASFTNTEIPGSYQYFSCSHPDPKYQGPGRLISDIEGGAQEGPRYIVPVEDRIGKGFVWYPTKRGVDGKLPEAEIGNIEIYHGIPSLTSEKIEFEDPVTKKKKIKRLLKVIPTSKIKNITFVKHQIDRSTKQTAYKFGETFTGLGEGTFIKVEEAMSTAGKNTSTTGASLESLFLTNWNNFIKRASDYLEFLNAAAFPLTVSFQGIVYQTYDESQGPTSEIPYASLSNIKELSQGFTSSTSDEAVVNVLRPFMTNLLYTTVNAALRSEWIRLQQDILSRSLSGTINIVQESSDAEKTFKFLGVSLFGDQFKIRVGESVSEEGTSAKTAESAVFPVSDSRGYEVVGTYQYGRDVDIAPNSSFEQLALQDPLSYADPADVEEFVKILTGEKPNYVSDDVGSELVEPIQRAAASLEKDLIKGILNNPGTPEEVIQLANSFKDEEGNINTVGFANWIASTQQTNFKLPVNNAAYMLADLQVHVKKAVCNCRAAEADILLEDAFNTENFAQVVHTDNLDQITGALSNTIYQKSVTWQQTQKALRGEVTDQQLSSTLNLEDRVLELRGAAGDLETLSDRAVQAGGLQQAIDAFDAAVERAEEEF